MTSPTRERPDTERARAAKAVQERMFAEFDAERRAGNSRIQSPSHQLRVDSDSPLRRAKEVEQAGGYEAWRATHDWRRREDQRSVEEAETQVRSLVGARVYDLGVSALGSKSGGSKSGEPDENEDETGSPYESPRRAVAAAAAAGANLLRGVNELFPIRTGQRGHEGPVPPRENSGRKATPIRIESEGAPPLGPGESVKPQSDDAAVSSLARRVAELESLIADRDVQLAQLEDERWRQDEQNAKLDLDVDAMRRDAETARLASKDAAARTRESSERERAALDACDAETRRADAADRELRTLSRQADIMAAQLEVASLRLDALHRDNSDRDVEDKVRGIDASIGADAERERAAGLAERLRELERDHARMVSDAAAATAQYRDLQKMSETFQAAALDADGERERLANELAEMRTVVEKQRTLNAAAVQRGEDAAAAARAQAEASARECETLRSEFGAVSAARDASNAAADAARTEASRLARNLADAEASHALALEDVDKEREERVRGLTRELSETREELRRRMATREAETTEEMTRRESTLRAEAAARETELLKRLDAKEAECEAHRGHRENAEMASAKAAADTEDAKGTTRKIQAELGAALRRAADAEVALGRETGEKAAIEVAFDAARAEIPSLRAAIEEKEESLRTLRREFAGVEADLRSALRDASAANERADAAEASRERLMGDCAQSAAARRELEADTIARVAAAHAAEADARRCLSEAETRRIAAEGERDAAVAEAEASRSLAERAKRRAEDETARAERASDAAEREAERRRAAEAEAKDALASSDAELREEREVAIRAAAAADAAVAAAERAQEERDDARGALDGALARAEAAEREMREASTRAAAAVASADAETAKAAEDVAHTTREYEQEAARLQAQMERLVASEKKSRVDAAEAREAYEASAKRLAAETELRISAEERATTSETKLHAAEAKFRSDEVTTAKLARERADADAAAAIAAAESRAAVAEAKYRENAEAKLEAERVVHDMRTEHEHETRRLRKQLDECAGDVGPAEVAAARREASLAEARAEKAAKELRDAREDVARLKIGWAEREAELKGELAGLRSQVGAAAMTRWQNTPMAPPSMPRRGRRVAVSSDDSRTDGYSSSESGAFDENDDLANVLNAGKSIGTRATIELMQRHASSTARLIENQEKMIAELRKELHSAIVSENPDSPLQGTAGDTVHDQPDDSPIEPRPAATAPLASPKGKPRVDWEAAYADMDSTRANLADKRRASGPGPVVESVADAPALRPDVGTPGHETRSEGEATEGDSSGDEIEREASDLTGDEDDLISVDERFSPLITPKPAKGSIEGATSPTPSEGTNQRGELVGDLYKKLAALGAQSASELLMQSPTVERQLSRML